MRFPSVDELASALRGAARLADPASSSSGGAALVWPIVGLDASSSELLGQIAALRRGGGIVVTGPHKAGRSTLLRRIAWSLGVERAVAWIEAGSVGNAEEALTIELAAFTGEAEKDMVVLVDDADRLGEKERNILAHARARGAKLVLVVGEGGGGMPGPTFEIFAMRPLEESLAGELIRRTIPSLSDAVVAHVVARAEGWPGRIRAIVTRLERAPVVAPSDVDRLLEEESAPMTSRGDIHRLLDRGHFDEAAAVLARYADDAAPTIAVARARLLTNRGDAARAWPSSRASPPPSTRPRTTPSAPRGCSPRRAHLRAGDYAEAERRAAEVAPRLGVTDVDRISSSDGLTAHASGSEGSGLQRLHAPLRVTLADSVAVRGLAQSFASRHQEARATLENAVRLARGVAEPRILSVALGSLAFALQRDDHLAEAKTAYEEALGAAEEAGDAGSVATTRLNLAGIAKSQGDLASAIRHLEAAVDMGRRSGRVPTLRQALLNLANLDLFLARLSRARVSLDVLARERADLPPQQHAQLLALEAEHAARSGDLLLADRLCGECAEAYEAMGRSVDEAEARLERVLIAAPRVGADPAELSAEIKRAAVLLGSGGAHRALLAQARGRVAHLLGEEAARAAYDEALETARAAGQKDWIWRALEGRAQLSAEAGQSLMARRDREAALAVLEEIASLLPRDLREVYWNDPRRQAVRAACMLDFASSPTTFFGVPGEDRLARVLEINRAIAGEHDLSRLLGKVTDHAIALLRAERGFIILRSGYARRDGVPSDRGAASSPEPDAFAPIDAGAPPRRASSIARPSPRDRRRASARAIFHLRLPRSGRRRPARALLPVDRREGDQERRARRLRQRQRRRAHGGLPLGPPAHAPVGRVRAHPRAHRDRHRRLYLETRLRPGASFAQELPTLVALADQVAIAIETARLVGENERRAAELEKTNVELTIARGKLEELLGHRTAQLVATRRDLRSARAVIRSHFGYEGLVGTSEAMRRVYALIDRVRTPTSRC